MRMIKKLRYISLVALFLLGLLAIVGSNGGGGSGGGGSTGSSVTPLDENNIGTFHGTYEITRMRAFGSDGSRIDTNDFDVFTGYLAIDVDRERIIIDIYSIWGGIVIWDISDIRTESYYSSYQSGGEDIEIDGIYLTEYVYDVYVGSGVYADYVYSYQKISDEIETQYFDILSRSSLQTSKSESETDKEQDIFVGIRILYQIVLSIK